MFVEIYAEFKLRRVWSYSATAHQRTSSKASERKRGIVVAIEENACVELLITILMLQINQFYLSSDSVDSL